MDEHYPGNLISGLIQKHPTGDTPVTIRLARSQLPANIEDFETDDMQGMRIGSCEDLYHTDWNSIDYGTGNSRDITPTVSQLANEVENAPTTIRLPRQELPEELDSYGPDAITVTHLQLPVTIRLQKQDFR